MRRRALLALLVMTFVGCTLKDDSSNSSANAAPPPAAAAEGAIPAPPDVAAIPADAQLTATGLASKILASPGLIHPPDVAMSTVTVHYTGWSTDGKMFDSSVARNEPATFGLGQVIPGWIEGMQLMVLGEKRRFWIPGKLAYDAPGARPDAPKGMLVFDIELLDIK